MNRENIIGYAMLVMGLAVVAVMLFSLSALAADEPMEKAIGPVMESGKDLSDTGVAMPRTDPRAGELTKEMEKPMRTPDVGTESSHRGYRPLCGPAKDAINHVYCAEGYDSFAF